jgi:hypothetical protein
VPIDDHTLNVQPSHNSDLGVAVLVHLGEEFANGNNLHSILSVRQTRESGDKRTRDTWRDCGVHMHRKACTVQPLIHDLPFGGVGNSGIGKYHGEWGFRAYSNVRGVLYHSTKLDVDGLRYPPYNQHQHLRDFVIPS